MYIKDVFPCTRIKRRILDFNKYLWRLQRRENGVCRICICHVQMQKVLKNNPKVYNFTLTYRLMISLNVLSWWILILK